MSSNYYPLSVADLQRAAAELRAMGAREVRLEHLAHDQNLHGAAEDHRCLGLELAGTAVRFEQAAKKAASDQLTCGHELLAALEMLHQQEQRAADQFEPAAAAAYAHARQIVESALLGADFPDHAAMSAFLMLNAIVHSPWGRCSPELIEARNAVRRYFDRKDEIA